jgi:asparaginyl-tRNA synthetase
MHRSSTLSFSTLMTRKGSNPSSFRAVSSTFTCVSPGSLHEKPLKRTKIKKIFFEDKTGANNKGIVNQNLLIQGWVKTMRDQKHFSFIEVNDGSTGQSLQVIADSSISTYPSVRNITTGSAVEITGQLIQSSGKGQKYELKANEVKIVGDCPVETYPLQKKRHTLEYLRSVSHLRARTNTISAVSRIRSSLAAATHRFFQKEGFIYVQTPLITSSDCEGAGEMFHVTSLPINEPQKIPLIRNSKTTDFTEDFFGKPTYLTVSGQLAAETYSCALGDIYTFGPTFRAEKSQTTRHLAEFHMIEPEMAFSDYHSAMDNAEEFIKYLIHHLLNDPNCENDLQFFQKFYDKNLINRLQNVIEKPFIRLQYSNAIELLQKEIQKDPSQWIYPNLCFGSDLNTEHERWLAEKHFQSCVFILNYPRKIKSFYMKDSTTISETVDCFDLLVPGVGELIGGSQREENYEKLSKKIEEFHLRKEDYEWYLDLRKYGSVPHSGYGLGFERLVCYITGIENIRDAIAYPRSYKNAEF